MPRKPTDNSYRRQLPLEGVYFPVMFTETIVTPLTINRFGERDIDAMIDRVVGNKSLPPSIRRDIVERTDGIPLFVEEMTKAVLEAKNEGEARQTAATVPSPALAVPAILHASLIARLDRLGPPPSPALRRDQSPAPSVAQHPRSGLQ